MRVRLVCLEAPGRQSGGCHRSRGTVELIVERRAALDVHKAQVERAAQLGYREFVDLLLKSEVGMLEAHRTRPARRWPACRTTRPSTTSTSTFSLSSTPSAWPSC